MIKGKRKGFLLIATGVVLIIIIAFIIYSFREKYEWEEIDFKNDLSSLLYAEIDTSNERNLVMVVEEFSRGLYIQHFHYIPPHHIVRHREIGRERRIDESEVRRIRELEIAEIIIYDLLTQELEVTIDALSVFRETSLTEEGYQLQRLSFGARNYIEDGEQYLFLPIANTELWSQSFTTLHLNLRTRATTIDREWLRSVHELGQDKSEGGAAFREEMNILRWLVGEIEFFEYMTGQQRGNVGEGGIRVSYTDFPGVVQIQMQALLLPVDNENLYTRFPGLRNFQGREDVRVFLFIKDYPTPEEILALLMEGGREFSFEGLVLSGDLSIDGEEHEIHSFDDFFKWRGIERWRDE